MSEETHRFMAGEVACSHAPQSLTEWIEGLSLAGVETVKLTPAQLSRLNGEIIDSAMKQRAEEVAAAADLARFMPPFRSPPRASFGGHCYGVELLEVPAETTTDPTPRAAKATVHAIHARGCVGKDTLHELAADPQLEGFMMVCLWKNGSVTSGWNGGMKHVDMLFMVESLREEVRAKVFPSGSEE